MLFLKIENEDNRNSQIDYSSHTYRLRDHK